MQSNTAATITIQFAKGGYVFYVNTDNSNVTEVYVSTNKLIKALRSHIDELSLLPKKADDITEM